MGRNNRRASSGEKPHQTPQIWVQLCPLLWAGRVPRGRGKDPPPAVDRRWHSVIQFRRKNHHRPNFRRTKQDSKPRRPPPERQWNVQVRCRLQSEQTCATSAADSVSSRRKRAQLSATSTGILSSNKSRESRWDGLSGGGGRETIGRTKKWRKMNS